MLPDTRYNASCTHVRKCALGRLTEKTTLLFVIFSISEMTINIKNTGVVDITRIIDNIYVYNII